MACDKLLEMLNIHKVDTELRKQAREIYKKHGKLPINAGNPCQDEVKNKELSTCSCCLICDLVDEAKDIYELPSYYPARQNLSESKTDFKRLAKLSSEVFKAIGMFTMMYNDLINELITSFNKYDPVIFYIIETKFSVWYSWLWKVLTWVRYLGCDRTTCSNFKYTLIKMACLAKNTYESILSQYGDTKSEMIKHFLNLHSKTFEVFIKDLSTLETPKDNGDYHKVMRKITFKLSSWMMYTLYEILSLERILNPSKESVIIVGAMVLEKLRENGINLVEEIRKYFKNDTIPVEFTEPRLEKYRFEIDDRHQGENRLAS